MAFQHTPETLAIVADIRQILDTAGAIENEQLFSFWVPNTNLLMFHIVADRMDTKAVRAVLNRSTARIDKTVLRGSGADEWEIEVHVPTYWPKTPNA